MTESGDLSIAADDRSVLRKAMDLHQQGHLEPAVALYQKLLEKDPDNPDALHYLGMAACSEGDFDRGFELIRKAIAIAPEYVEAVNNLGVICQSMGRLPEAEACYRRVIELNPEHADSHNNLGVNLKVQGRMSEAGKAFQSALSHDANHARAHHNLANLYRMAEHHDLAATHFQLAIKNGLKTLDARQALVSALMKSGDREEALFALEEWRRQDPENPVAQHLEAAVRGGQVPSRASDEYVKAMFDHMAGNFDESLADLGYQAPGLVVAALNASLDPDAESLQVLDAGCGTGICGPLVKPLAARLVGVDLSARMLQRAKGTGAYDELYEAELTEFLQARPNRYDIIICADTLCYFGDLTEVTHAAAASLKSGGHFVFTVEQLDQGDEPGFLLDHSGRYSHSERYIRESLEQAGLTLISLDVDALRKETGKDVSGLVVTATISRAD